MSGEAPIVRSGRATRWEKGFCPNPGGKRKGAVSFTAAIRRVLTKTQAETLARVMIKAAIGGDMVAAKILFDRIDGRVGTDGGVNLLIQNNNDSTTAKLGFDVESYKQLFSGLTGVPVSDGPAEPVHPALPDAKASLMV